MANRLGAKLWRLFRWKEFRVRGLRSRTSGGHVERGIECKSNRRQADFRAARLIAQLQRDVLRAKRGTGKRGYRKTQRDGVFVDVQRRFRKREGVQRAFGIRNLSQLKARGRFRAQVGGDQVVFRFFARVDVKARADFQDRRDLKLATAPDGVERNINRGSDNVLRRRNLLRGGRQSRHADQQQHPGANGGGKFHSFTGVPSCCETTRFITAKRSSPVFSSTNAFFVSDHPSLKEVDSAEIQISRIGVFGETTNFTSSGSSKITSSFPLSPSTSKPCSSATTSNRFFSSAKAASAFL